MRQSLRYRFAYHLALVAIGISLAVTPSTSQVTGISLAWDRSAGPVDGYLVHVGTSSGWYDEIFDAGPNTAFTYRGAVPGIEYFFVVTAYRTGRSSLRTEEVSAVLGGAPRVAETRSSNLGAMSSGAGGGQRGSLSDAAVSASCPSAQSCYAVRLRASGLQPVTALASTPDGDLLVVEAGRRLRIIDGQGVLDSVALEAPEGRRITDVMVGPDFATTGHVYVGVTHSSSGLTQDFSIVRYRYVHQRMGEAAVIVAAIPVVNAQSPRMAIDRLARIYVAMPAGDGTRRDPYAGMILRFAADGTTPAKARAASPILAAGFEIPLGLTADAETLWAIGFDRRRPNVIGRLPLDEPLETGANRTPVALADDGRLGQPVGTRLVALSASPDGTLAGQQPWIAYIDSAPRLHVARLPTEAQPVLLRDQSGDLLPDAVLLGHGRRIYVAARDGNDATLVLELIAQ